MDRLSRQQNPFTGMSPATSATPSGTTTMSSSREIQTYINNNGHKLRNHLPAINYENNNNEIFTKGMRDYNEMHYHEAETSLLHYLDINPMSVSGNHYLGLVFSKLAEEVKLTFYDRRFVPPGCCGCCCATTLKIPDTGLYEQERKKYISQAEIKIKFAYLQSKNLSDSIRSRIAYDYALVAYRMGDYDLKCALITRAVELDRYNLDAKAMKEDQIQTVFKTRLDVTATAQSSAVAMSQSTSSSYASNMVR